MISIIISSYRENYYKNLSTNIAETIGNLEYEIIEVVNPGLLSLSKAYNQGAKTAKFRHLLFIHEDIEFLNKDWGFEIVKGFEKNNVGILGLAGGSKKSSLPTGHDQGINELRKVFVYHTRDEIVSNIKVREFIKIKTLDGVFLAMTKEIWKEYKFNEKIGGFHFYDLDLSLRTSVKYQNYIIPSINILHFSIGKFDNTWVKACLRFHDNNYSFDNFNNMQKSIIRKFWFKRLLKENIKLGNRIKYIVRMGMDKKSLRNGIHFILAGLKN